MSLSNSDMSPADVAAVVGNGGNNGFGWGDGSFWIIILFLFAFMGNGWGGNWGGNGTMNAYATQYDMQRGFDQTATMAAINGVNSNVVNGFASAEVANCDRLANLTSQMTNIAMNQQANSYENRAAVADLKYTVATENCADRNALAEGIRDVIDNQNANYQQINDKLCRLELDAKDDKIATLQAQVNNLQFAASQVAQNGYFQNALNDAVNKLQPTPVPAYSAAALYPSYAYGLNGFGGCGCNGGVVA